MTDRFKLLMDAARGLRQAAMMINFRDPLVVYLSPDDFEAALQMIRASNFSLLTRPIEDLAPRYRDYFEIEGIRFRRA